jgi:DNA polymerase-3 subunit beta
MKLSIDRAVLLRSLSHVYGVVERRNTIPILSNLLLRVADGRLAITATDMDLEVVEMVDCCASQSGETTVSAQTLYDIVRKLPDGSEVEIAYQTDPAVMTVRAGRSKFRLSCLPVDEFPILSAAELPIRFSVPTPDLMTLIDRTRFAVSTEETRYYLNGIYLHVRTADGGDPHLLSVATDGHRLARVQVPLPEGAAEMAGIIIPRKTVNEIRKLLDDAGDAVLIELGAAKIRLTMADIVLTSKLIDGTFPDYERVIPASNDKTLRLERRDFAEAVDRVATIASEKSRAVKISLGTNTMVLTATSPDTGSATEELAVTYDDGELEIGFNSRYLLDISQQIAGETVEIKLADAASPTVVADANDNAALFVIMPMRV